MSRLILYLRTRYGVLLLPLATKIPSMYPTKLSKQKKTWNEKRCGFWLQKKRQEKCAKCANNHTILFHAWRSKELIITVLLFIGNLIVTRHNDLILQLQIIYKLQFKILSFLTWTLISARMLCIFLIISYIFPKKHGSTFENHHTISLLNI